MTNDTTDLHWYALKVFYNKVFEIEKLLTQRAIKSYIPCETIWVERNGVRKSIRKPIVSSLLFFRSSEKQAIELQQHLTNRVILYTQTVLFKRKPLSIPDREMNLFMLISSSGEKGMEYFASDCTEFRSGEHVRVIEGPFKGAEGYIRRIKGNRRLIVSIQGVCAIATSYIPQCFLQKI